MSKAEYTPSPENKGLVKRIFGGRMRWAWLGLGALALVIAAS